MARFKRCITCRQIWNISQLQEIPGTGYECPKCEFKRKKLTRTRQFKVSA